MASPPPESGSPKLGYPYPFPGGRPRSAATRSPGLMQVLLHCYPQSSLQAFGQEDSSPEDASPLSSSLSSRTSPAISPPTPLSPLSSSPGAQKIPRWKS